MRSRSPGRWRIRAPVRKLIIRQHWPMVYPQPQNCGGHETSACWEHAPLPQPKPCCPASVPFRGSKTERTCTLTLEGASPHVRP